MNKTELPDIDCDFNMEMGDEAVQYMKEKYGIIVQNRLRLINFEQYLTLRQVNAFRRLTDNHIYPNGSKDVISSLENYVTEDKMTEEEHIDFLDKWRKYEELPEKEEVKRPNFVSSWEYYGVNKKSLTDLMG